MTVLGQRSGLFLGVAVAELAKWAHVPNIANLPRHFAQFWATMIQQQFSHFGII
jgi:hypothetical protein